MQNNALLPSVTIIVLNYNGRSHLQTCFDSLRDLEYPVDKLEIMFVDNGSNDGSEEFVRGCYPEIRIAQNKANLGFAEGNNVGARLAKGEILVFLNNDTKVETNWLIELIRPLIEDDDIACAASKILDWQGQKIDFVGAHLNFHGFASQEAWRIPVDPGTYDKSCPLLMACGGSMAIRRQVFLGVGGFDKDFFVFYEDVDLGWRLWVLGYKVVFTPKAITYHRHHSTSSKISHYRRMYLYERNALYMIIKNYEAVNLDKVLPAALFLAVHRTTDAIQETGVDVRTYHPDNWATLSDKKLKQNLPLTAAIPLLAMRDVISNMPHLMEKRAKIQTNRRRSDQEIFSLFGQPFKMYTMGYQTDVTYAVAHTNLIDVFQLDQVFRGVGKKILIMTTVGLSQFGFDPTAEGTRLESLGNALAQLGHQVIYSMPKQMLVDRQIPVTVSEVGWESRRIDHLLIQISPDILIASHWHMLENLNKGAYRPIILDTTFVEQIIPVKKKQFKIQRDALEKSDLFLCQGEKQCQDIYTWLTEQAIDVSWDSIQSITDDVSLLDTFCRRPRFTGVKPVRPKPTPLYQLPIRAWQIISDLGLKGLTEEIGRYIRWRVALLSR